MIENKTEKHQVTQEVVVEHNYFCDVCNKKMKVPQHYWLVTIQDVDKHDNWGDSKTYDCCSEECVKEIYDKYLEASKKTLNNYNWIEITHEHTLSVKEFQKK